MEVKLFYKTQRELATALNLLIDDYWQSNLDEEALIKHVQEIFKHNSQKVFKQNDFTTILKQQCGKRRLEVVENILDMNGLISSKRSVK